MILLLLLHDVFITHHTALASDSVSTSGSRLILARALGGGIAGALLLILLLLAATITCCLSRKSKVISRSEPLAQQGDSDVADKWSTQHIIQSNQNLIVELKSNEAYDSTTHYIPTEDNVAYGQTAPQIPTEDNLDHSCNKYCNLIGQQEGSICDRTPTSLI